MCTSSQKPGQSPFSSVEIELLTSLLITSFSKGMNNLSHFLLLVGSKTPRLTSKDTHDRLRKEGDNLSGLWIPPEFALRKMFEQKPFSEVTEEAPVPRRNTIVVFLVLQPHMKGRHAIFCVCSRTFHFFLCWYAPTAVFIYVPMSVVWLNLR